jgi:hypothetical protein
LVNPKTTVCFDKKMQPLVVGGKPILKSGGQAELKQVRAVWDKSLCFALKEFT